MFVIMLNFFHTCRCLSSAPPVQVVSSDTRSALSPCIALFSAHPPFSILLKDGEDMLAKGGGNKRHKR